MFRPPIVAIFREAFFERYITKKTSEPIHKFTSLKMAKTGGQNMQEAYDVHGVVTSHMFICTCWFYSHNESLLHVMNILTLRPEII